MRMKKKATNVSLDPALVAEARRLGISLSEEFGRHLAELVKAKREEQWLADNQAAFAAYEQYFEKHGLWNEDEREW
jgi:antitoxin CcdA